MKGRTTFLAGLIAAGQGLAHPHVFVDAGLTFLADESGALAAVEVYWAFDELSSMILLSDYGITPDAQDVVPSAILSTLAPYVIDWSDEGFDGDIEVTAGSERVALAGPVEEGLSYANGRLVAHHVRPLAKRHDLQAAPVAVRMFDPDYYIAYDVTLSVTLPNGLPCQLARDPADLNAAYSAVEDILYGPAGAGLTEDEFPKVGALFADTLTLSCAGS